MTTQTEERRTPAQVLQEARRRDSRNKRARVVKAVEELARDGQPITFAAVARAAEVSTWLVYADGVRHHIEEARRGQAARPVATERTSGSTPAASLRTDLELAREEIHRLRGERDKLRRSAQLHLGQQLDQISSKDLVARIDELTAHNDRLDAELRRIVAENNTLQSRVVELEDDLGAARTSLRRMLRANNQHASDQPSEAEPA